MINIVITTYNKEKYIGQLLDSLYNQINDKVMVYCIDDKSTDNTLDIIKKHSIMNKENFCLIANAQNSWVSYCRNLGISKCKSNDWLTFIDGDDWVAPDYIEKLLSYITNDQNDVYVFDYNVDPVNGMPADKINKLGNPNCWQMIYKVQFLLSNNIAFKDTYKTLGFGEDVDFWEQLNHKHAKIDYKQDLIYNYHWGIEGSLSNTRH
jgi:glycosyltransferase involved in cell wall biosynthesis